MKLGTLLTISATSGVTPILGAGNNGATPAGGQPDRAATAAPSGTTAQPVNPDAQAREIAKAAYIYAAPMIQNYATIYKQAVDKSNPAYVGGFGHIRNYSEPFTAKNRDIVTPNNDTPYSWAWLDLRGEPWVFSVPKVSEDRYYVAQWFDLFTFNFAYVGSRATGNHSGNYLFVGPDWQGETPKEIDKVFHSETQLIGMLGRTAIDGPGDVSNVKKIQDGYKVQPLSAFLHQPTKEPPPPISFPPYDDAKAHSHDFIGYLNFLLQFALPSDPSEVELREKFATIGIKPGEPWDSSRIDPALLGAVDAGVEDAKKALAEKAKTTLSSNGLFGTRAFLKNDYLVRAIAAAKGIYGNSLEEAWYGGFIGDGTVPSQIHFSKEQLPQARFFWSMTLYTLPDRLLYDNAINRYSIGDRTHGLKYEKDGSLTFYISHAAPTDDKRSNWLPAPDGKYSLVARIYGPGPALVDGSWKLPPLEVSSP